MTNINNVLQKLNALSSKESKDIINKFINSMKTNQKISKSFNFETTFTFSILSIISTSFTSEKILEFLIEVFKIMY